MVRFSMRKIGKDDRALINVLRHEKNWSSQRLLQMFPRQIGPGQAWTGSLGELILHWRDRTSERQQTHPRSVGLSKKNIELLKELICSHESALHVHKNPHEIGREMDISAHCKA